MAITGHHKNHPSTLLKEAIPAWKSDKELIWIWLSLRASGYPDLALDEFREPETMKYMATILLDNPREKDKLSSKMTQVMLDTNPLDWITGDKTGRLHSWLLHRLQEDEKENFQKMEIPPAITGTGVVLAHIDFWPIPASQKLRPLDSLHRRWNQHLQDGHRLFKWFHEKESKSRCMFAWDWMDGSPKYSTWNCSPFETHKDLLAFFDQIYDRFHIAELESDIKKIKTAWTTKKSREKKDDVQCAVWIPAEVNEQLNSLIKGSGKKKKEVIEMLIRQGYERGFSRKNP